MDLLVEHVDVWAATIPDRPGGLADVLGVLRDVGANLRSIISRRVPDDPGKGVVFVTPLQGDREIAAAAQVGFNLETAVGRGGVLGYGGAGQGATTRNGHSIARRSNAAPRGQNRAIYPVADPPNG